MIKKEQQQLNEQQTQLTIAQAFQYDLEQLLARWQEPLQQVTAFSKSIQGDNFKCKHGRDFVNSVQNVINTIANENDKRQAFIAAKEQQLDLQAKRSEFSAEEFKQQKPQLKQAIKQLKDEIKTKKNECSATLKINKKTTQREVKQQLKELDKSKGEHSFVYAVTNASNKIIYVGRSSRVNKEARFYEHRLHGFKFTEVPKAVLYLAIEIQLILGENKHLQKHIVADILGDEYQAIFQFAWALQYITRKELIMALYYDELQFNVIVDGLTHDVSKDVETEYILKHNPKGNIKKIVDAKK